MIKINLLKLVFIAVFTLTVFIQFELIVALFTSSWDVGTLYFFIPFFTLVAGSILLWMNKKLGIFLLAVYSTYCGAALFAAGVGRIVLFVASEDITNSHVTYMIFPTFEPVVQAFVGLVFIVLAWILSKTKQLEESKPYKNIFSRVISVTTVVALALVFK